MNFKDFKKRLLESAGPELLASIRESVELSEQTYTENKKKSAKKISLKGTELSIHEPQNGDLEYLTQKINQETPEFGSAYPFAFVIKNKENHLIAGCNGSVVFGSIYTDQLWVSPKHRKSGLGHQLMEKVHQYGRENGCTMATVCTMSFQNAKTFYEKLGYKMDFERPGYTHNSSCIFLKRDL